MSRLENLLVIVLIVVIIKIVLTRVGADTRKSREIPRLNIVFTSASVTVHSRTVVTIVIINVITSAVTAAVYPAAAIITAAAK